jgi:fructokinase
VSKPLLYGGIEGGGTKFICAVGAGDGPLLARTSVPTSDAATTLAACVEFFRESAQRHGAIAALGIGCFGPLQLQADAPAFGHMLDTPKPGWSGVDVVAPLRAALGVPVAVDTDVAAAALAEWQLGAGRGLRSLAYVTVGTGIGGASLPQPTARLMHAEMGHLPMRRDARDARFAGTCPFHHDCAEGLASGPSVRARWGCDLSELPAGHVGRELIAGYLGQLAAAIVLMLGPHRLVMGGGVMNEAMLARVRVAMRECLAGYVPALRQAAEIDSYLCAPALGSDSGIHGALLLARAALA